MSLGTIIRDQVFAILDKSFQGDIKITDHKHKSTIVSDIAQIWLNFITMCTFYISKISITYLAMEIQFYGLYVQGE